MTRLPFWPTATVTFGALVAFALLATLNGAADLGLRQGLDVNRPGTAGGHLV